MAESLKDYFVRNTAFERKCSKGHTVRYLTTENPDKFKEQAQIFLHEPVDVEKITLG